MPKNTKKKSESNLSDELLELAQEQITLFVDQDGNHKATIDKDGHEEIVDVPSKALQMWLRRLCYVNYGGTVASDPIIKVEAMLDMLSHEPDIPKKHVYTRIAQRPSGMAYNINNSEMLIVNKKGVFIKPISMNKVCFKKSEPQCKPNLNSPASDLLTLIGGVFRVSPKSLLLFAVWLCSCFIQSISHPILILHGREGSSKTTALRTVSRIIDPVTNDVFTLPRDRKSLIAVLSNRYFLPFDNLQILPQWVSDLMCNASTGGSEPMRALYSNNTLINLNIKGCVGLNGVENVVKSRDLRDRSIFIELQRIPDSEWKPDSEYFGQLQKVLPDILGSIFNALHAAFVLHKTTKLDYQTRLADFCVWGYCIAEAINRGLGQQFLDNYTQNQSEAKANDKPDDLVLCIQQLMSDHDAWKGSTQSLYSILSDISSKSSRLPNEFPINKAVLTRKLLALQADLNAVGISVAKYKNSAGIRGIRLVKKPNGDTAATATF